LSKFHIYEGIFSSGNIVMEFTPSIPWPWR